MHGSESEVPRIIPGIDRSWVNGLTFWGALPPGKTIESAPMGVGPDRVENGIR
ncbi:MAG: hypothetical protein F6K52_16680 [Moorea sp. SIO3H5]|nr:hypothetical protein [Moorena sp. SIO3H5]